MAKLKKIKTINFFEVPKVKRGKNLLFNPICTKYREHRPGWAHRYNFKTSSSKSVVTRMVPPRKLLDLTYQEVMNRKLKRNRPEINEKKKYTALEKFIGAGATNQEEYEERVLSRKNIEKLKKIIPSKTKTVPIPFIQFNAKGEPVSHEGRHTSKAAEELGYKTIPITIEKPKGVATPIDNYLLYSGQYKDVKIKKPLKSFHDVAGKYEEVI